MCGFIAVIFHAFEWKFEMYLLIAAYVWLSLGQPGNFIYTAQIKESLHPETEKPLEQEKKTETVRKSGTEGERIDSKVRLARLVSLPVTSLEEDLCMSFWYRFTGVNTGALHIWQRESWEEGVAEGGELQEKGEYRQRDRRKVEQEKLLWGMEWRETKGWKEGRILMPHADKPYMVTVSPQHPNKPLC